MATRLYLEDVSQIVIQKTKIPSTVKVGGIFYAIIFKSDSLKDFRNYAKSEYIPGIYSPTVLQQAIFLS